MIYTDTQHPYLERSRNAQNKKTPNTPHDFPKPLFFVHHTYNGRIANVERRVDGNVLSMSFFQTHHLLSVCPPPLVSRKPAWKFITGVCCVQRLCVLCSDSCIMSCDKIRSPAASSSSFSQLWSLFVTEIFIRIQSQPHAPRLRVGRAACAPV